MQERRSFRYRLEPSSSQREDMEGFAGSCRFLWNWMLHQRSGWWQAAKEVPAAERDGTLVPSYSNQSAQLKAMKVLFPWLKACDSQALQQKLIDLDKAFKAFYEGRASYPKFKRKGSGDSFRYPQRFRVDGDRVFLPKLGWVRMRMSRREKKGLSRLEGAALRQATVVRQGDHWFVSISCEIDIPVPKALPASEVGIDLGAKTLAVLSDGTFFEASPVFRRLFQKLRKAQRSLSCKVRLSSNWRKAKRRLERIHRKIADARLDALHKATTTIGKSHALVVVEDLRPKAMSASAKGTRQSPGRGVKARGGLNRGIADSSWGAFVRMLEYKLEAAGGRLVKVDPAYTSQRCCECGEVDKRSRVSRDLYRCRSCGAEMDADLNAARNILAAGRAAQALGDIRPVAA